MSEQQRIDADILIVGNGEKIDNGSVVIEGSKIVYAGGSEGSPQVANTQNVPVLMPGMWETHGHFAGMNDLNFDGMVHEPPHISAMRTVHDAKVTLEAGFTSVREVGGYGLFLKKLIKEGSIPGPRIYAAGAAISMTGGHGDIHSLPLEVMHYMLKDQGAWFYHADGPVECMKAVRTQLRRGAEVIKLMVSGGVLSEIDDPMHQQFNYEEVKALVDEAHRSEVAVAAHCHGPAGMANALNAGVDSIEHGTFLNEELADQMVEQGTILVPTRLIVDESMKMLDGPAIPEYAKDKMRMTAENQVASLKLAIKKGITIACGTDIAGSKLAQFNKWGTNARELGYYVDAGMSTMDAIVTATGNGPKTLGGRAPKSGQLQVGYDADILLLNSNPLADITVLQNKSSFVDIIKSGKSIK